MLKNRNSIIILISFLFLNFAPQKQDKFISEITTKFQQYNQMFPREKVYLQLNKTIFKPKQLLWFKAYIVESLDNKPSDISKDLTVKLIDETGEVVFNDRYSIKNGFVQGNVKISKSMKEGIYTLVSYSNWMQNGSEYDVFSQSIIVVNSILPEFFMNVDFDAAFYQQKDSVSASIQAWTRKKQPIKNLKIEYEIQTADKIVKKGEQKTDKNGFTRIQFSLPQQANNRLIVLKLTAKHKKNVETRVILIPTQKAKTDMTFFPEGGSLVDGIFSRVAFQAVDDKKNPVNISGVVVNQNGDEITTLETGNNGIGTFSLKPSIQDTYDVLLTEQDGTINKYRLPKVSKNSIAVSIESVNSGFIFVKAASDLPYPQKIFLLANIGGHLQWVSDAILQDSLLIRIPVKDFPIGVAQITLFDSIGTNKAERLVFINKNKYSTVSIQPDKVEYLPKEETKISIKVTDEADMPIPVELCLSVLSEHRLLLKATPHLLSTLLFTSELKQEITDPNFYFEETSLTEKNIDRLLITQTARSFSWDNVLRFDKNKGLVSISDGAVSGIVYDKNKTPMVNTKVWLFNKDGLMFEATTNDRGKFVFFSDGNSVSDIQIIKTELDKKQEDVQIEIKRNFDEKVNNTFAYNSREIILNAIELDRYKYSLDWQDEKLLTEAINIDEHFSRTEKADARDKRVPPWKRHIVNVGVLEAVKMIKPFQIISGVIVFHGVSSINAPSGALIVIDGLKRGRNPGILNTIIPHDVENIQIHTSSVGILEFSSFAADGVIEITTIGSGREQKKSDKDIQLQTMKNPL